MQNTLARPSWSCDRDFGRISCDRCCGGSRQDTPDQRLNAGKNASMIFYHQPAFSYYVCITAIFSTAPRTVWQKQREPRYSLVRISTGTYIYLSLSTLGTLRKAPVELAVPGF